MAPTTRAVSKRAGDEATDAATLTKKAKGPVKKAGKPAKSKVPVKEAQQYFRFLDLSSELRNRIYDLATEDNSNPYAPRLTYASRNRSNKPRTERIWKFFALTQVCRQARAEFRPLWIRNSRVRFGSINMLTLFISTFLRPANEPMHIPKEVQYSWIHGQENGVLFQITDLLVLYANRPSLQVAFVPDSIACGDTAKDDICFYCMRRYDVRGHGCGCFSDYEDDCECADGELTSLEYKDFKYEQMEYTSNLPKFIQNANEAWLKVVRDDKVSVACSFCSVTNHAVFQIRYKDPACQTALDAQSAWDLFRDWGILELDITQGTDFIMAYEDEQVTEKDGYRTVSSVVREVHIRKIPPKA